MRKLPKPETLFPLPVSRELQKALKEIGPIKPWLDEETGEWMFEHPLYPESYSGESPEEVVAGYPLYLGELIKHRMDGTLAPETEVRIQGRGGRRPGAGRPRKAPTLQRRLPQDVALWLDEQENLEKVRRLMSQ